MNLNDTRIQGRPILVYHIGSFGDTLAALPALIVIRKRFPHSKLVMVSDWQVGQERVLPKEVIGGVGLIDEFFTYDSGSTWNHPFRRIMGLVGFARVVRRVRPGLVVYLVRVWKGDRRVVRDKLFFRVLGVRRIVGMDGLPERPKWSPGMPVPTMPRLAEIYMKRLLGITEGAPPQLDIHAFGRSIAATGEGEFLGWAHRVGLRLDKGEKMVAFGVGSKMAAKRWPIDRYTSVAKALVQEFGIKPIAFGSRAERQLAEEFISGVGAGIAAAGELSIAGTAAALRRCVMYVGNDTGVMHLAATVGIPCVAVFSARDYRGLWEPIGDGHVVLRVDPPCALCEVEDCPVNGHPCMTGITVEDVLRASREILARGR